MQSTINLLRHRIALQNRTGLHFILGDISSSYALTKIVYINAKSRRLEYLIS